MLWMLKERSKEKAGRGDIFGEDNRRQRGRI